MNGVTALTPSASLAKTFIVPNRVTNTDNIAAIVDASSQYPAVCLQAQEAAVLLVLPERSVGDFLEIQIFRVMLRPATQLSTDSFPTL